MLPFVNPENHALFICSDNGRLASCGGDKQVFLWDVSTGRIIRRFRGHDSEVRLLFSILLGVSTHNAMRFEYALFSTGLWTGQEKLCVFRESGPTPNNAAFVPHALQVNAVCFNDESSVVVSAGYDRSIRVWDCRSQSANSIQVSIAPGFAVAAMLAVLLLHHHSCERDENLYRATFP